MDLSKLRKLASNATPGPWVVGENVAEVIAPCPCCGLIATCAQYGPSDDDPECFNSGYIAAFAPNVAISLLDEIERLGRCNEQLARSHAEVVNHQNAEIERLQAEYLKLARHFYDTFRLGYVMLGAKAAPVKFEESRYGKRANVIAYGKAAKEELD